MELYRKQLKNFIKINSSVVFYFAVLVSFFISCSIVKPEKSNLFKIKKIKRYYDGDFIIIAKRNDSLFYIRSFGDSTNHADSKRIRRGGYYSLDLYDVMPYHYSFTGKTIFVPAYKHMYRYSERKFHWKYYYPNNLNGLYLETPPSDRLRKYLIKQSLSFKSEFDDFIYEKDFDKRFTIKENGHRSIYKVLSITQLCPDRILIKTRKDDSTYYMVSKVYPCYNVKSKRIKKGQLIYLETQLVKPSSNYPDLLRPNQGCDFYLCEHGFLNIKPKDKSKEIFDYYLIENLNGLYYMEEVVYK